MGTFGSCAAAMIFVLLGGAPALCATDSERPVIFRHAVILDGRGGEPILDGSLVVRGATIEAVGSTADVPVPAGAKVIDLAGKTVLPGLADMHVHLAHGWDGATVDILGYQRYLNALLHAGVTTVLDTGNVLPFVVQLRDEVAAGRLAGPRIYCAGPLIDGADLRWPNLSRSLSSADQVPGLVRELKRERVDLLKAYVGLADPLLSALVREARGSSLRVLVDQSWRNGSLELVMGDGVAAFAHAPDMPLATESLRVLKQREVAFVTTLAVVESQSRRRLSDLAFLESPLIQETTPAEFLAALRAFAAGPVDERTRASAGHNAERLRKRAANVKALFDAGVLLAAGTDAPYPGVFQGEGIHRELELLVEAGLRPLDALTLATRNAARLLGAESQWGTLEAGRRADLVVVRGRPDLQIQDTRNVELVMQNGRVLDRAALKLDPRLDPGFRPVGPTVSSATQPVP